MRLKVISWNVQFFAGKNYCFFYDSSDGAGKDWRPSYDDMMASFEGVCRVIEEERPDVVLLQEVDIFARRTHYVDQAAMLRHALGRLLPYASLCPYWKVPFVPHPKVMGPAGMHLMVMSRFPLQQSLRPVVLPRAKRNWFVDLFHIRRKLQQIDVCLPDRQKVRVVNVHLEAFPAEADLLARQVQCVDDVLSGAPMALAAGDFNLLPNQKAYQDLPTPHQRELYNSKGSEMELLYKKYAVLPTLDMVSGSDRARWYTFNSNDRRIGHADRTLDYFVLKGPWLPERFYVRSHDTTALSDHFPVIIEASVDRGSPRSAHRPVASGPSK